MAQDGVHERVVSQLILIYITQVALNVSCCVAEANEECVLQPVPLISRSGISIIASPLELKD